ncbi:MAG TPA: hypothetical protein PLV45_00995 [bacterium]|nr:hypothetical protein [bacterium]
MINIDLSCLYVLGMLTVLNYVLNRLLYQPVLTNFHQRRDHIISMRREARSHTETARIIRLETHAILTSEKRKAEAERRHIREMTEAEARAMVEDAIRRTEAFIESHRNSVENDKDRIRREIAEQVPEIKNWFRDRLLPICIAGCLATLGMIGSIPVTRAADPYVNPHGVRSDAALPAHGEPHAAPNGDTHGSNIRPDLEKAFNLLLLFIVFFMLLRKPVGNYFVHRAETVRKAIESATHELEFSNRELQSAEAERSDIESARKSILRKTTRQDRLMHEKILENAREKTRDIEEKSHTIKTLIDDRALQDMNAEVVDRILEQLTCEFSCGIDEETDRKLVVECIRRLEKLPSGGGLTCAKHPC